MTQGFAAILLVCLATVPREQCTEATAVEVRSTVVDNELGCTFGWQELIARSAVPAPGDEPTYLKTLCRRVQPIGPKRTHRARLRATQMMKSSAAAALDCGSSLRCSAWPLVI